MLLIKEANLTNHHKCLLRYFAGYGHLQGQDVQIYAEDAQKWKYLIPKKMDKKKLKELQKLQKGASKSSDSNVRPQNARKFDF